MEKLFQPITVSKWTQFFRRVFSLVFTAGLIFTALVVWGIYQPPMLQIGQKPANPQVSSQPANSAPSKVKKEEDPSDRRAVCIAYVDVEGGVTPLYPLQPGRVVAIPVRENQEVESGDVLIRLDDTLQKAQLEEARADVQAGSAQLDQAKLLYSQHDLKLKGQKAAITAKKEETAAVIAKRDQAERLEKNKLVSIEDVKAAQAFVRALEAAVEGETAKLKALESMDPQLSVNMAQNDLQARKARLQKAEFALKECAVSAPFKGSVLRINTTVGETLGPNPRLPAIMFSPAGKRIIRAEVEQEFASKISLNQLALIQDDCSSSPANWKGKVVRISEWFTHRRSILLEPLQFNDVRTLECIVELDPGQPPLRIGQRVRVQLAAAETTPTVKAK
ncbi:MAG: biotin/lipoyl-binding protein [Gemmataceae bacterium]|nr:biotin/lipoyl-binding protein [Gemmataceae bacterium]